MSGSRFCRVLATLAAAIVSAGVVSAGTRTYVSLAGRDDSIPKLGIPGISVRVEADSALDAAVLRGELARQLAQQVHTRRLAKDESGDYDLEVSLRVPSVDGPEVTVPFEAVLRSAQGERLWRIEGRADVVGDPLDDAVVAGIGRNVISALIHDGWVQQRYDPDNPPPPPPVLRHE
jgi:hypothetical protein